MYKLLAADMDGTLLNSKKQVTPKTRRALEALHDRGIVLALCTGRNIPDAVDAGDDIAMFDYGILTNGSLVWDFRRQKALAETALTLDQVHRVMATVDDADCIVRFLSANMTVMTREDLVKMPDYCVAHIQPLMARVATFYSDMKTAADEMPEGVLKINMNYRNWDEAYRHLEKLKAIEDVSVVTSDSCGLEVCAGGTHKGMGLAHLASSLGIAIEETVAVGDSGNDLGAILAAGLGVAMGNADEAIKEAADFVVADCDHDGIVELIDRFFL